MKRYHASNRHTPHSIGASMSDRSGAVVSAFWLVALALIVASIDRPAQAEPFKRTGDIQLAGRHEDGKASPQKPAYRPERSKCWRK